MKLLHTSVVLLMLAFMSFALVAPVIAENSSTTQPPSNPPPSNQSPPTQSTSNQPPSGQPTENLISPSQPTSNQQPTSTPTENNITPPQPSTYTSYAENFFGSNYNQYTTYVQQYMPPTTAGFGGYLSFIDNYQPYIQQLGQVVENFGTFYENTFSSTPFQTMMSQNSTSYAFGMMENYPGLIDVYAHLSENDPQYSTYQTLVGENFTPPEWVTQGGTGWQVENCTWVPSENWQVPQGWTPPTTWTTPENWTPPQDMYSYVVPPWMPQSAWTMPDNWCPATNWVSPDNWMQPNFSMVATQVQGMFENAMATIMPSMSGPSGMMPENWHWVPPENRPFFTWNMENISPGSQVHIFMDENFQPWMWSENQVAQQMGQSIGQFENAIVGGITLNPNAPIDNLIASVTFLDNIPENVAPPEAQVCGYLQIGTNADDNIENAEIGFEVSKDWISANEIDENSLTLQHYVDGTWEDLSGTVVGEDENYVYMEATTPSFSTFAVTGSATGTMPTVPSSQMPPMYIIAIAAIALLVVVLLVVWRRVSFGTKTLRQ